MSIFIRTVPTVMAHYGCTAEDARRYIDLRDEGHGVTAAALMAGISDPQEDDAALVAARALMHKVYEGRKLAFEFYEEAGEDFSPERDAVRNAMNAADRDLRSEIAQAIREQANAAYEAGYAKAIKWVAEGE